MQARHKHMRRQARQEAHCGALADVERGKKVVDFCRAFREDRSKSPVAATYSDQGGAGLPGVLRAQIELLMLFREVTMGQSASAVARAEERRQLFREHLSTRAGYGYALLAVAFDTAGRPDAARQYWHDATLLVPEAELLERFEELAAMKGKYPEAERTL